MELQLYKGAKTKTPETKRHTLPEIAHIMATENKGIYSLLRELKQTDEKKYKAAKIKLTATIWSGIFEPTRAKENLQQHTGLICFDIDGLTIDEAKTMREVLSMDNYTRLCFLSPSGEGIKIIVAVDIPPLTEQTLLNQWHENYFDAYKNYFEETYKIKVDPSGRDSSRLCFLSYDPNLYYNISSNVFDISALKKWSAKPKEKKKVTTAPQSETPQQTSRELFEDIIKFTNNKAAYISGSRNNFINLFAMNCKHRAIEQREVEQFATDEFWDYVDGADAIKDIIKSVYNSANIQFGKFAKIQPGLTILPANAKAFEKPNEKELAKVNTSTLFWYEAETTNKTTGEVKKETKFSYDDAITFLQNNGFYKFPLLNGGYQFIRLEGKIVNVVTELHIKEFMLDFLKLDFWGYKDAREMFRRGSKNYSSASFLEGLDYFRPEIQTDTPDTAFIYFKNVWLEISAEGITKREYSEMTKFIYRKQVIDFDYIDLEKSDTVSVFERFLSLAILGEPETFSEVHYTKMRSVMTSIGYLLHQYKHPDVTKAVVAVDKTLRRTGESNGRSGKSLFSKALAKMLNTATIDGKNFKFDYEFAFQKCTIDTRLINFNDINKKFDFERLFGIITEEFNFQKKGKDMVTIPFEDSPKIYISTNFSLTGDGESFRGRQQIVEFGNYFNSEHTPFKEFGHRFFNNWDAKEWTRFYGYMITCLQSYLKNGLVSFPLENYAENRLIDAWGIESVEWCEDNIKPETRYSVKEMFEQYMNAFPSLKYMKQNTFSKRVIDFANIQGWTLNDHMATPDKRDRSNGVDYWTFTKHL